MKTFQETIQSNGLEYVNDLMNGYTMVYEKINASTLSFKRIGDTLYFYKGRSNEEINDINSMLYTYFQNGIDHIKRTSMIFYMEFPENWLFRMQYVVSNDNNMINYKNMPQNNLILSCIDTGNTIIEDPNVLKKWAERLQIDYAQPIFNGFMSEFQKEKLTEYLSNGDLNGISFSQYVISLLNPQMTHSALSDEFMGGIDSFIFKFYKPGSKKSTTLKLVDPYMTALIKQNKHEFGKIDGTESEIILANFIAYLQTVDIKKIKAEGETENDRYIDIICKLFNEYIKKEQNLLKDVKGNVNESYSVNLEKIKNQETVEILQKNPSLTTVFQIITGMFMNTKDGDNGGSLISGNVKDAFNKEVEQIWNHVSDKTEDVKSFKELMDNDNKTTEDKVMSFTDFMKSIGEDVDEKDDDSKTDKEESDNENEKETGENQKSEETEKTSDDTKQEEAKETKSEDSKDDSNDVKKEETEKSEDSEKDKDSENKEDKEEKSEETETDLDKKEEEKSEETETHSDLDKKDEKKSDENTEKKDEEKKDDESKDDGSKKEEKKDEDKKDEELNKGESKSDETKSKKDANPDKEEKPKEEKPDNIEKQSDKPDTKSNDNGGGGVAL